MSLLSKQARSLVDLLGERSRAHPDRIAFRFLASGEEEAGALTFADLDVRARAVAAQLQEKGLAGQRVLLLYPPGLDFISAFLGCLYAGVVAVPAYPSSSRRTLPRLQAIAEDARPAAAFTHSDLLPKVQGLSEYLPGLEGISCWATDVLDVEKANSWEPPAIDGESLAFLQYTSGSTATPKGVMVSHGNLVANERLIQTAFQQTEESTVVGWLPVYHDMGLIGNILQPLYVGAASVLMSPVAFLQQPLRWLKAISQYKGSTSGGPNFAYELCVDKISPQDREGLDLSSWKVAFNGAEPVRSASLDRFAEAFAPHGFSASAFYPCYGLAEATLFVTGGAVDKKPAVLRADPVALESGRFVATGAKARDLVGCGRSWGEQRVVVVDPVSQRQQPDGTVGEVWVAGPSVAKGYWQRPDATAESFEARLEGDSQFSYLRTGDLGFFHRGELVVTGRIKDLIILRGRNLYPQDIELSAERSHPALRPGCSAAFSVDRGGEERLVVVLEVERRREAEAAETLETVRSAVAEEFEARAWKVVAVRAGSIPKTSSGKIQRRRCRQMLLAEELTILADTSLGDQGADADPKGVERAPGESKRHQARDEDHQARLLRSASSENTTAENTPAENTVSTKVPNLESIWDRSHWLALPRKQQGEALELELRHRLARKLSLDPNSIDAKQSLSALGVDSLAAIELRHGIEELTGVAIELVDLLQGPTLEELRDLVLSAVNNASGSTAESMAFQRAPVATDPPALEYPLTAGQRALWFLYRLAPESSAYLISGAARLRGSLEPRKLHQAVRALARRHRSLRVLFEEVAGEPRQRVQQGLWPQVEVEDASSWSSTELQQRLEDAAARPFDLQNEAPFRVTLFQRDAKESFLVMAVHHIVADFWSLEVLLTELGILLGEGPKALGDRDRALPELKPLPAQFGDFVAWQEQLAASPQGEREGRFWERALSGCPDDLELPTDRPRPSRRTFAGSTVPLRFSGDLLPQLESLSRSQGTTLFMTLASVIQILLSRHSRQTDLCLGTPTAGRSAANLAGLVGYFVNPVTLRVDLGGDPGFTEALARSRQVTLDAFGHQSLPFPLVVERLEVQRDLGRSPLFQVMFALQKARSGSLGAMSRLALGEAGVPFRLGDLTLESMALPRRGAQFDLAFSLAQSQVVQGDGDLTGTLQYDTALFDRTTIARFAGHFSQLLDAVVAAPAAKLSELSWLSAGEVHQVQWEWNANLEVYPRDGLVHEVFAARARLCPDAPAVSWAEGELFFGQLVADSDRLALELVKRGVGPESLVGIWAEAAPELVVALMAVFKAGGGYLPLDPGYPLDRLAFMVETCGTDLLLVPPNAQEPPAELGCQLLRIEACGSTRSQGRDSDSLVSGRTATQEVGTSSQFPSGNGLLPDHPAYVIFTSGSTGRPKGVVISHRATGNRIRSKATGEPSENTRVLQRTSLGFDISVIEIFTPLCTGGTIVMPAPDETRDPVRLLRMIARENITSAVFPASIYAVLLEEEPELVRQCTSLELSGAGGEAMPVDLPLRFHEVMGDTKAHFYNRYGPTETTVAVTSWRCHRTRRETVVPIGRPISRARVFLVDRHLNFVPAGVTGELCIAGEGLARGYLGLPGRTAQSFVPDPFSSPEEVGLDEGAGRLYRSGDLALQRPDGAIEFVGRVDHQVKIRGFRVEPGEVAAALRSHEIVRDAAVIDRKDKRTQTVVLNAYVVAPGWEGGEESLVEELFTFLRARVPEHMVPATLMPLDALPLTLTGKLDRKALPVAAVDRAKGSQQGPRNPQEEVLASLFRSLLGLEEVDIRESFFALGGHSLLVTQLLSRIRDAFGVDLPMSTVFERSTIVELAGELNGAIPLQREGKAPDSWGASQAPGKVGDEPGIVPVPRQGGLELSFAQERLWFLEELEGRQAIYNIPAAVHLAGSLDVSALHQAVAELTQRHESLRTSFHGAGGRPLQTVQESVPFPARVIDLSALPEATQQGVARQLTLQEAARPFDLGQAPLLRLTLLRFGPELHRALLVIHHIVADGWSLGIFVRELGELYDALHGGHPAELMPLKVQYADFAHWQRRWLRGDVLARQLSFWSRALEGAPGLLELPTDRPRPAVQSHRGELVRAVLPKPLRASLQGLAHDNNATPFMVLLTAYFSLLSRYSGQSDLVVGSPIANRNRTETEGIIGFLVNTLCLRGQLSKGQTFREALAVVRETVLEASAHQDLPFEHLVEELAPERNLSYSPLFQVMLVLQTAPLKPLELEGLTLAVERLDNATAKFDLTLSLVESERGFEAGWEYSKDLLDATTVVRWAQHFERLLGVAIETPECILSRVPLLDGVEQNQLLREWNSLGGSQLPTFGNLVEAFTTTAQRLPDALAVAFEGQTQSYQKLDRRSNRLARHLLSLGLTPEGRVGVCLGRSLLLPEAVLAVFKAGGVLIPLDPTYPQDRLAFMVEDSRARLLLTEQSFVGILEHLDVFPVVLDDPAALFPELEDLSSQGASPAETEPPVRIDGDNLPYVIYTSGSTGVPKGIAMPHKALVALIEWQNYRGAVRGPSRTLQFSPLSFDVIFQEMFSTWALGGSLHLVSADQRRDPLALLEFLERERIERLFLPFVALRQLAEVGEERGLAPTALREIVTAGEQLQITPQVAAWFERLRQLRPEDPCRLENQYGPSETHVATAFPLRGPVESWPPLPAVGRPVEAASLYLLDDQLQPVPAGVAGEIFLGGPCVARGYLDRPGQTAEVFLPDFLGDWGSLGDAGSPGGRLYRTGDRGRFDALGNLTFLGRTDHQVKIRGFRVEPGEVEALLVGFDEVRQALVQVLEKGPTDKRLVAYVVPTQEFSHRGEGGSEEAHRRFSAELHQQLRDQLPPYLVPSALVVLGEMPLAPSGKVSRALLPEPDWSELAAGGRKPRGQVETLIAGAWCRLLDLPEVAADDDFFHLGGHSLLATRLVSHLRELFAVDVSVRQLFEAPTVMGLAQVVKEARLQVGEEAPPITASEETPDSPDPLSFAQERLWFLDRLDPDSRAYHMPGAVQLDGPLEISILNQALEQIVERHQVLRSVFFLQGDTPSQQIQPSRGWDLPVVDLGGLGAEARSRAQGQLMDGEDLQLFSLGEGPLLRTLLVRLEPQQHIVLLNMHHIVSDAWSMEVLVSELSKLYAAGIEQGAAHLPAALSAYLPTPLSSALPPLPVQYGDFARWQRSWLTEGNLAPSLDYWREQLEGAPPALELLTDSPRPTTQSFRGRDLSFDLAPRWLEGIDALARENGTTPFLVWLATLGLLFWRYSGQRDLVVGSPVAGRDRQEVEGLIGCFINLLPFRLQLQEGASFEELISDLRETALGAFGHQEVPFERLVEELVVERDLSHTPIVQVLVQLLEDPFAELDLAGLRLQRLPREGRTAKYDLMVNGFRRGSRLKVVWSFNQDLFDDTTIERMARHLETLLGGALEAPGSALRDLPTLSAADRQQILEWNDTAIERREESLPAAFSRSVESSPNAVAILFGGETVFDGEAEFEEEVLTYRELANTARRLARHLRQTGVGRGHRVGILAHRSLELVVGMLAVLECGGAYVPLDPDLPPARLQGMVDDASLSVVLVQQLVQRQLRADLPGGDVESIVLEPWIEASRAADKEDPTRIEPPLEVGTSPSDPAYMIFTSGSTGRPKGAINSHRGILNRLRWGQQTFDLRAEDRVLQKTPFSFDVSVWEFFWPLLQGAQLIVAKPGGHRDSAYLAQLIQQQQITVVHFVPSMLVVFLEEPAMRQCRSIRQVFCSGEALPLDLAHRFLQALPEVQLHNLYGPTEAAVEVTWWPCGEEEPRGVLPIGRPIANTRIEVLDSHLRPVPLGAAGELHIGGVQVGGGYWGRPALTAERFVPDPWSAQAGARLYRSGDLSRFRGSGEVEYLGRTDFQVKVRGFRIELGEIEAVLVAQPGVQDAVVVALEGAAGDAQLAAYWVASAGRSPGSSAGSSFPDEASLRQALAKQVPEYMVPPVFVRLSAIPLTTNGKVDRRALPAPTYRSEAIVLPRTPLERTLADLWEAVLETRVDSVRGNFFGIGGNSIRGAVVINRLQESLGITLPVVTIFDAPTVAQLAEHLAGHYSEAVRLAWGENHLELAPEEAVSPQSEGADQSRGSGEEANLQLATAALDLPPLVPASWQEGPRQEGQPLPVSFAQERLWFLEQLEPGRSTYNVPAGFRVEGLLHIEALQRSVSEICRRHSVLRGRFESVDGQAVLVTEPPRGLPAPLVDLSHLGAEHGDGLVRGLAGELALQEALAPFDLGIAPLLRLRIFRCARQAHLVQFTFHHIVSDAWSLGVFVRELSVFYEAFSQGQEAQLPPLPIQYPDYAQWQRSWLAGEALESQLDFWRGELGEVPSLNLPTDRRRSPADSQWPAAVELLSWSPAVAEGVRELAQRGGASVFMTLLAGVAAVLGRYAGQQDFALGTPVMGRSRGELEQLIGFFVNTVALRFDLRQNPSFEGLLKSTRSTTLKAFAHQDVPFEKLVEALRLPRDSGRSPVFQALFTTQTDQNAQIRLPGLDLEAVRVDLDTAKFDLTLALRETDDGIRGWIEYRSDLFDGATIRRLAGHLQTFLSSASRTPEAPISRLAILPPVERAQLLEEWVNTSVPYPRTSTVHEQFTLRAQAHPDRPALLFQDDVLTYGELEEASNRLARFLVGRLGDLEHLADGEEGGSVGGAEPTIGLALERSPELVIAILAVFKIGGHYLPLDPAAPGSRQAYMLETASASLVLTRGRMSLEIEPGDLQSKGLETIDLEARSAQIQRQSSEPLSITSHSEQLAYVMFTSGSTGQPKGVEVCHRSILRLILETDYVDLGEQETFLMLAPTAFDASTFELWAPLLNGGRLAMAPEGPAALDLLGETLERYGVTTLWLTSGLFHQLVEEHLEWLRPVRQIMTGGDVVSPSLVQRVLEAYEGAKVTVFYGPTENTTFTTSYPVPKKLENPQLGDGALASLESGGMEAHLPEAPPLEAPSLEPLPLGKLHSNNTAYILSPALALHPVGVHGQLYVAGDGLARGYAGRPALTAERFIPHPFPKSEGGGERLYATGDLAYWLPHGHIGFVGRVDNQIKLRGFRIELSEIQSALVDQPNVADAVVVARSLGSGDTQLVGYYVPQILGEADLAAVPEEPATEGVEASQSEARLLRQSLLEQLPAYMVPAVLVEIASLPLKANGKVDREALPDPDESSVASLGFEVDQLPRTTEEEILCGLFAAALERPRVGRSEDFFELGGHSLLATRLTSRIRQAFQVELPLEAIFSAPSPAGLALEISALGRSTGLPPIEPGTAATKAELSFAQQRLWFLSQLELEGPLYNVPLVLRLEGDLDSRALGNGLREILRRHQVLRSNLLADGEVPYAIVGPVPAEPLLFDDLSALGDAKDAALEALARRSAVEPFDLSAGPMMRARLVRLGDEDHALLVNFHHIAVDGWSLGIFQRELSALYGFHRDGASLGAVSPLPELRVQYADYAHWQRQAIQGSVMDAQLDFWRQQLSGVKALELPTDRPRPEVQDIRGGTLQHTIPQSLLDQVKGLGHRLGATLFMTVMAGLQCLFQRLSQQEDFAVGTPIAGRDRGEVESSMGMFVNTLALPAQGQGDPSFEELLVRVRSVALGAYGHQEAPFERLVDELDIQRHLSRTPLFQVMFALQTGLTEEPSLPGVKVTPLDFRVPEAKFDLTMAARETSNGLAWATTYASSLFDATRIQRFHGQLVALFQSIVEEPSRSLSAFSWLSAGERHQVVVEWNLESASAALKASLGELLKEELQRQPQLLARSQRTGKPQGIGKGEQGRWDLRLLDRFGAPVPIGVVGELCLLGDISGEIFTAQGIVGNDRPRTTEGLESEFAADSERGTGSEPGSRDQIFRTGSLARAGTGGLLERSGYVERASLSTEAGESASGVESELADTESLLDRVEPRTELETRLVGIWSKLLDQEDIGVTDDFFQLGGHSLLGVRLVSRVRRELGLELPLASLFQAPTIEKQAALLSAVVEKPEDARSGAGLDTSPGLGAAGLGAASSRSSKQILSSAQQQLWFRFQLDKNSSLFNIPAALRLEGDLDVAALEASLTEIFRRHEVLRSTFAMHGEAPFATVQGVPREPLAVRDLSSRTNRQESASALARQFAVTPFDLASDPLMRVLLVRLAEREHWLLVSFHHIAADGWSIGVFRRELCILYDAFSRGDASPLPELPMQYADFARSQREILQGEVLEGHLTYWRSQLANVSPLELPADRPRPAIQDVRGGSDRWVLPAGLLDDLKAFGQGRGVTLFMTLLAAAETVFHRLSGQQDFVIGTPLAGRTAGQVEGCIGMFVNALPLRAEVGGDPSFEALVERVRDVALGAFGHQEVPFEKLVEELSTERDLARTPIFQVVFALQSGLAGEAEMKGLEVSAVPLEAPESKYDLTLVAVENAEGMALGGSYALSLFDSTRILRLLRQMGAVLESAVDDPSLPLSQLSLLRAGERHQVVGEWSVSVPSQPATDLPSTTLHGLFEEQARQQPEVLAAAFHEERITYGELDRRASTLAEHLGRRGIGAEVPVGLLMEPSMARLVAVLAVLKAGGAFVALDPGYPVERLRRMVEDAAIPLILTDRDKGALFDEVAQGVTTAGLVVSGAGEPLEKAPGNVREKVDSEARQSVASSAAHLACVIFTSGSTGIPHGVQVEHQSLVNIVTETRRVFELAASSRVAHIASFNFDAAVLEIFATLASGASLWMFDDQERMPGEDFSQRLVERQITHMVITPTALALLPPLPGLALTHLLAGGEALPAELAERWSSRTTVINGYGPTETSVYVTAEVSPPVGELTPAIGRPVARAEAYVLDPHGNPVPIGVPGELCIGGPGLTRGYLGRPRRTAQRFVPNPFADVSKDFSGQRLYRTGDLVRTRADGRFEFVGRIDHQVKLRGLRIELGEVESHLRRHPLVDDAAALVEPDAAGGRLVAFAALSELGSPEQRDVSPAERSSELLASLASELPAFMVPSSVVVLHGLPRTPTGKLDRQELRSLSRDYISRGSLLPGAEDSSEPFVPPRNPLESRLSEIWNELLGGVEPSVTSNFFTLGGHSLLAVKLVARIRQDLGLDLPLAQLFQAPTIALQASWLEASSREPSNRVTQLRSGADGSERRGQRASLGGAIGSYGEDDRLLVPLGQAASSLWFETPDGNAVPETALPLFFVHAVGGTVFAYRDLAQALERSPDDSSDDETRLSSSVPLVGIAAPGIDGEEQPMADVAAMAERYLRAIRRRQPTGPYRLGGWSFGGYVALEMARQLEAVGERVALVALVETTGLGEGAHGEMNPVRNLAQDGVREWEVFAQDIGRLVGVDLGVSRQELQELEDEERLDHVLGAAQLSGAFEAEISLLQVRGLAEVYRSNVEAARRYEPAAISAPIHLWLASEGVVKLFADGFRGLSSVGLTVDEIPGDHYSILRSPKVERLARELRGALNSIAKPRS